MPSPLELLETFRGGRLQVAYQGQWDLDVAWDAGFMTSAPVAVEALSRWNHPEIGRVSPEDFIPLAEQGGFLDALDADVLARAATQVAAWNDAGHAIGLSVNAAPSHFSSSYAESAIRIAQNSNLELSALTIEITEAPAPQLRESMRAALERLRSVGVSVSVDDFGAGGTTLDMLQGLPIDEVKLDRSLVQRDDADADAIVHDVVGLAHESAWRVVAEGIETTEDLERSVLRGCHRGQGFLWGRPVEAAAMELALV